MSAALTVSPTYPRAASARLANPRVQLLDIVRGCAIVGVVVYHLAWDLHLFRFLVVDVTTHPLWVAFARALAGTFMTLVGISLVLAHRRGIRWLAFHRRLLKLTAAAATISIVTYIVFPDSFIYFGILHAITVSSVIGLAFLKAPLPVVLLAAVVLLVLPHYVGFEILNPRSLAWTGIASSAAPSNDFVPIAPWSALTLIGIFFARLLPVSVAHVGGPNFHNKGIGIRAAAWAGRKSLLIYLLHQPLLLGVLYALRTMAPL